MHDNNLTYVTHGRPFLEHEYITPLRQIASEVANGPAHLFRPEDAIRIQSSAFDGTPLPMGTPLGENRPNGAFIDYFLNADSSDPVVLEIDDSAGKVVRRYSSTDRPQQVDPKTPDIPT